MKTSARLWPTIVEPRQSDLPASRRAGMRCWPAQRAPSLCWHHQHKTKHSLLALKARAASLSALIVNPMIGFANIACARARSRARLLFELSVAPGSAYLAEARLVNERQRNCLFARATTGILRALQEEWQLEQE